MPPEEPTVSKMMATTPNPDDARFVRFCEFLRNAQVKPARGLMTSNYTDDHKVIQVDVIPQPGCDTGYCWFNCLDQQDSKGGEVVYGWLLWSHKGYFGAEHHAIWLTEAGQYIDPTPNESGTKTILFMPDNRAPFDIQELRCPPSLKWRDDDSHVWFAQHIKSETFFIVQMVQQDGGAERVNRTRDRYVNR